MRNLTICPSTKKSENLKKTYDMEKNIRKSSRNNFGKVLRKYGVSSLNGQSERIQSNTAQKAKDCADGSDHGDAMLRHQNIARSDASSRIQQIRARKRELEMKRIKLEMEALEEEEKCVKTNMTYNFGKTK
ncbi:hypothetical protein JTB14_028075 [Gonioctena quinquepunctata]|nr:hypothetical protein JTB14_028075 [Gonioctena quinquepunctata]